MLMWFTREHYMRKKCALWSDGVIVSYCFENDKYRTVPVNGERMINDYYAYEINKSPFDTDRMQRWMFYLKNHRSHYFSLWWRQVAAKIMRLNAIGFFVGFKSCLRRQTRNFWVHKNQHPPSNSRSTSKELKRT